MTYLKNHRVTFEPIDQWPGKETKYRKRSNFGTRWSKTLELLDGELWKLQAKQVVIQVDLPRTKIRQDGAPRSDARMGSPRVILSFVSKHGPLTYPCDRFDDWQDNVRAISLALEALRKVDRYGVTANSQQYRGFQALPNPNAMTATSAASHEFTDQKSALNFLCHVTNSYIKGPLGIDEYRKLFREAQVATHPDRNFGESHHFKRVQAAGEYLGIN